ncbi:hypothetical protein ACM79M_02775 [Pseudomonas aeruginosa]
MTNANECTCPSGDGSLRHPCPAHPAQVEQAGDERAAQWHECTCPKIGEKWNPEKHGKDCPVHQARAALAQPSPVSEALIYACKNLAQITSSDGSGHADIAMAVLRMAGVGDDERERLVNEWKAARAWKPAPAQAEKAEAERPEVAEVAFVLRSIGAMDAEDIDGDNVDLRFEDAEGRDTGCDASIVEYAEKAADLLEQQERTIAGMNEAHAKLAGLYEAAQAQHSVPGKYDDVLLPFLKSMEHELHANAGKGDRPGWLQMDRRTALLEIYYHLAKLQKATKDNDAAGIVEYAADVANMSMMLVDVCGLLAAAPGKEGL